MAPQASSSGVVTLADLGAPATLPIVSTPASSSYNGLLSANGYGSIPVRITGIMFSLDIIASEDHAANYKAFYARQVQTDAFRLNLQFVTSAERRAFYIWGLGYAAAAVSPSAVGLVQVTCDGENLPDGTPILPSFSMSGILTSGMAENTTTTDVTWQMTLSFSGAQFTSTAQYLEDSDNLIFSAPSGTVASKYFYPESTDLTSGGPDAFYTSSPSYLNPVVPRKPTSTAPAPSPVPPNLTVHVPPNLLSI